jgi:histidinol-phosphate/aromatic aminotransferase/cobyric acid decarboxylase-like protein
LTYRSSLPVTHPEASVVVAECRRRNLFLRDVANMGKCFDARTLRVAVKDAQTNAAMLHILRTTLAALSEETRVKAA